MPTFPRTKTAQLSQFELRSVWQRRIGSEEAEEREWRRRSEWQGEEERDSLTNREKRG